jgi:hypothetical protein
MIGTGAHVESRIPATFLILGLGSAAVGAASDEHAGGTPGEDKSIHRFHLVKGKNLKVSGCVGDKLEKGSE